MNVMLNKNDEIVMKLLHYFITESGYNPVVLHGAKDEIWLEKTNGDYQIIRIVSNYIHNDEQLNYDLYKTKQIIKKIGYKMFSFNMNVLSIFVNLGDNVDSKKINLKNVEIVDLKEFNDLKKYDEVLESFPNILEIETDEKKGVELFVKLTNDINQKNMEENKKAEEIFSKKLPIITYIFLGINILLFALCTIYSGDVFSFKTSILYNFGGLVNFNNFTNILDFSRLITSAFLHGGLLHFIFNMYALYIIGPQIESFYGKIKYIVIYIGSAIVGNLLSMLFMSDATISIGASGAIFGLFGALLYFGYHYRVYLSGVLKTQIIPLIVVNLAIGFVAGGINNFAHIGGLIGGILISKAIGVKYKSKLSDIINGIIMLTIFVAFLLFMILK